MVNLNFGFSIPQIVPLESQPLGVKQVEITEGLGEYEIPASEIRPGLYLGNKDNAYNMDYLKALGITHVLNVAEQAECPHGNHFIYEKIPLLDTAEENILKHIASAFKFIDEALKNGKILVHCISGMSRSASIVAAWLISKENIDVEEALSQLQDKRMVDPNEGFREQLATFAKKHFALSSSTAESRVNTPADYPSF